MYIPFEADGFNFKIVCNNSLALSTIFDASKDDFPIAQ
jgi:hypothetical protein